MRSRFLAAAGAALTLTLVAPVAQAQEASDAVDAAPIDPAKVEIARQIVDIGFPEESREAMFFGTMDQMTTQMREASLASVGVDDAGAIAILDEWIAEYIGDAKTILRSHIPSLMDGLARAYANTFTEQELIDVLAFVSTPSGQRFFELSPAIIAEPNFALANQAYMDEIMAGMPEAQGRLRDRLIEYLQTKAAEGSSSES